MSLRCNVIERDGLHAADVVLPNEGAFEFVSREEPNHWFAGRRPQYFQVDQFIGGGFRFPLTGFSAYVEARYHSINNTSIRFVPVSFGLVF